MLKMLICLFLTLFVFSAQSEMLFITPIVIQDKKKDLNTITLEGRAVRTSKEDKAQLTFYIRSCGQVMVPSNKKGVVPKEGQRIRVFLKRACQIDDWEAL